MREKPYLRLVSTFSGEAYPYSMTGDIDEPDNPTAVQTAQMVFRGAISLTGMPDYKLITRPGTVTAYFSSLDDHHDFIDALRPVRKLCKVFTYKENTLPPKTVERSCKIAERELNDIFAGQVSIRANTKDRTIRFTASKAAYFAAKRMDPMGLIFGSNPY